MRKIWTADEMIAGCMTVGELVKALSGLPQDARLVKFAGGDCDGYVPIVEKEFKVVTAGVRNDINTNQYHGPFELIEKGTRSYYGHVKFLKKFKAVEL